MGYPKLTPSQAATEGFRKAAAGNARRKREHLPRHQDAFFGMEEGTAFLLGVRVPCRSRWVRAVWYDADTERLYAELGARNQPSVVGYYPDVSFELAEQFASSPSKGGFFWDHFIRAGRPFVK